MGSLHEGALEHNTEGSGRGFPTNMKSTMNPTTSPYNEVGIDVSKDRLDVVSDGKPESFTNDSKGIRSLLSRFEDPEGAFRLSCEATGPYSRLLVANCLERGVPVSIVNARAVRNLARASGKMAKTDGLDALLIARYAKTFDPPLLTRSWFTRVRLAQLLQRIDFLTSSRTRCKASLDSYDDPEILSDIRREIRTLDRRIASYRARIDAEIGKNANLAERRERMARLKGVGPVTATALVVTMPELGSLNRKEVAALCGLAPMNRDSGRSTGKRMIQAGRSRPRRALYMAALSASRFHPTLSEHYRKLKEGGKPPKVALTAIARKLAIMLNTSLKPSSQT